MPPQVERVDAIEHTEVVRFAPDDLLAAEAQAEGERLELDVEVRFAQLILELQGVASAGRQIIEPQMARLSVDVALREPRRRVVDAIVDAAIQQKEARPVDERDVDLLDQP